MFKALKKWWKYLGAKLNRNFDKKADPAVQLEQALAESQQQHRRLKEQAANVIASQKTAEIRLNGKPLAITMRTPGDDFALAAGFLVSEGVLAEASDLRNIVYAHLARMPFGFYDRVQTGELMS